MPVVIIVCILCLGRSFGFASDNNESVLLGKSVYFYDQAVLLNQWTLGKNPASLHLSPLEDISRIKSSFNHSDKNIKRAMDPGKINGLNVHTESLRTIGRVKVNGLFGYQNYHYNDLLYNGNMDFSHTNVYTLGDTLGGKQRQEGYYFKAQASLPFLNNQLLTGIGADYEAAMGAKMQDLRNSNTISKLRITPGIIYQLNNYKFGLSGGPVWENNHISVSSVLDERHNYFFFKGMGHFVATRNMTGTENVRYESNGYEGTFQMQYKSSKWQFFQSLGYQHLETKALIGSSYRLLDGITDVNQIGYHGNLIYESSKLIHQMNLQVKATNINGTEVQQETRSVNEQGVWVSYIHTLRWIDNKHIKDDLSGELSYSLFKKGNNRPLQNQFTITAFAQMHEAGHYPIQNYGFYESTTAGGKMAYRHFFKWGTFNIDPMIGAGARIGLADDNNFISYENYFEVIPATDFRYLKEDYFSGNLGINFSTTAIPLPGIVETFLDIHTSYTVFPNIEAIDNTNFSLLFSLGVIF